MAVIGAVDLAVAPVVAVGFSDKHSVTGIHELIRNGLSIAEIRIDLFSLFDPVYVKQKIAAFSELGTIGTIRSEAEGGKWKGTEARRLELFREIVGHVDSIDIELGSDKILRDVADLTIGAKKPLIVSYHDFEKTPERLELDDIINRSKAAGASFVKIATMVECDKDFQLLKDLIISRKSENLIVIGMGARGAKSRLEFPGLGSLMTYAYLVDETAPGQSHFPEFMIDFRRYYPAYNEQLIIKHELMEYI